MTATLTTGPEGGRTPLPPRAARLAQLATGDPETPETPTTPAPAGVELAPIDLEALAAAVAARLSTPAQVSTFGRFGSAFDMAAAARAGDPDALVPFAIADQITTDNPGVMPPSWLSTIVGIIDRAAPAITALGGVRSLGDSGMELDWPYFDGDLSTIVGAQAVEKTDVTSVKVSLKKGSTPLATYAGGSDISWQLIARSSPSYREAYLRILAAAYAVVTEGAFEAALNTNAPKAAETVLDITAAGSTADVIRAAVFAASAKVEDATGAPATVMLAASNVWLAMGGKPGLVPQQYGTQNVAGTADAASLRIEVSGLPVLRARSLPNDVSIVTNAEAAGWHGTGALFASADDVTKLGTDQVVWGMGASAAYIPAGLAAIRKTASP